MGDVEFKIFLYLIIVFSAVFHEYCHGWMAYALGDPTAKYSGRLTLNPLKHIDPIGTVILPLFLLFFMGGFIGWAKPVPYNPYNLKDQRWGSTKVALAGPGSNILIALVVGLSLRFLPVSGLALVALHWVVFVNIFLALFNLIPLPPLDGSKLIMDLFPRSQAIRALGQSFVGIFLAIMLALWILSPLSQVAFRLIVGNSFLAVGF